MAPPPTRSGGLTEPLRVRADVMALMGFYVTRGSLPHDGITQSGADHMYEMMQHVLDGYSADQTRTHFGDDPL